TTRFHATSLSIVIWGANLRSRTAYFSFSRTTPKLLAINTSTSVDSMIGAERRLPRTPREPDSMWFVVSVYTLIPKIKGTRFRLAASSVEAGDHGQPHILSNQSRCGQ